MGFGGLGLAWREASALLGAPAAVGEALLGLAVLAWLLVAALHALRLRRHPQAMAQDLKHPVRAAFAGAASIGLLIAAAALAPHAREAARLVWLLGAGAHVLIAAWTVRELIEAPREPAGLAPPLLIPLVGNVLAPTMGVGLGFERLSMLMFGLGMLLWAMLQPLLLGRLIHGPALPPKLRPTLAIFIAPPAVGSLALAALTGGFGAGPLALYGLALFFVLVFALYLPRFLGLPFAMSWWGWTFPTAAFSIATQHALAADGLPLALWQQAAAWASLLGASLVLALVAWRTGRAGLAGELLRPEA